MAEVLEKGLKEIVFERSGNGMRIRFMIDHMSQGKSCTELSVFLNANAESSTEQWMQVLLQAFHSLSLIIETENLNSHG